MPETSTYRPGLRDRLAERALLRLIEASEDRPLPERRRFLAAGVRWLVAPVLGWPGLVAQNLALVRPDLPRPARRRLAAAAGWNAGASLAEILSPDAFRGELAGTPVAGPGVAAMKDARLDGRGSVLVTAEIGNPDALVAVLAARGLDVATLEGTPEPGDDLGARIEAGRARLGGRRFPDSDGGRAALEAHVARGGVAVVQADQITDTGAPVLLFGARVRTPVLAASMALRTHAEFIPAFALRHREGGFGLWLAAPVFHDRPAVMMQAQARAVEAAAREFMEQYLWATPRWRPERYLDRAAPSTGP